MTTEHTPRPWVVVGTQNRAIAHVDGDCYVAHANKTGDANLIAAAPDLLEALELCLATMAVVSPEGAINVLGAHDAIAKARGK